jgi:three-Cys-motif partner protein
MSLLSGYGPHTAAKHRILRQYLEAWLPIIERRKGPGAPKETDVVLVDGFAGSGRYDSGQQGSPLVMVDAYLEHDARDRMGQEVHLVCIEKEAAFASRLERELAEMSLEGSRMDAGVRHGLFADRFPALISELRERYGRIPPTFAFLDPFGLKDNTLELTSTLAVETGCEVLVYLPTGFMARFESTQEFETGLDNLYGDRRAWEQAKEIEDHEERRIWLRDRFGEVLSEQTTGRYLPFDIQPQGSSNIYSLVFSSQNRKGLQRMKAAMWKVDPSAGQFFRGGTRAPQPTSLFDEVTENDPLATYSKGEPDYGELERLLREHVDQRDFSIDEAADFTLYETIFRDDAHLKGPVLGELEKRGQLKRVKSSGQRSTPGKYPTGTILRFV